MRRVVRSAKLRYHTGRYPLEGHVGGTALSPYAALPDLEVALKPIKSAS